MMKTSLPVLIMKNMVLFPQAEVRLEFDNQVDKKLMKLAETYYDNTIVVVNPKDVLEVNPSSAELPDFGVLAKVKMKIDMPNGKTRAIIVGLQRVKVHSYNREENIFEALVSPVVMDDLDIKEELANVRTLIKHIELYVKEVPYISNTILNQIVGVDTAEQLTDIISIFLPVNHKRQIDYIKEVSATKRVKMIIEDINKDIEILKLEEKIEAGVAKELEESQKEFVLREKIKIIKEELGEAYDKEDEVDELKEKINALKAPAKVKKRLDKELKRYHAINPHSPELGIVRTYIEWFLDLPWSKTTKDENDLEKVKKSLDEHHYALENVKERIIEYLAVKKNKNTLRSPIICLVGPPGVGKTTFAQSIAKSLGRKVTKISVGGVNDEAEIVGHRRTYIGAAPGLIIQGMKKATTINPVFIIDEIDKMTKDIKGDPASALLEVLDLEQNKHFIDHYIEEEYDLSNVMFIATANYMEQIPHEMRDRLEIVELSSYTEHEKLDIAKRHLIPKQLEEHGLSPKKIIFDDKSILRIIRNYTKESGVRELDRLLATVTRKIVKEIVVDKTKKTYKIGLKELNKYLGKEKFYFNISADDSQIGVVNALAYTRFGGDILPIESNYYKGKGNLLLTGSLGSVMKESAQTALSYVKANAKKFKIDLKLLEDEDIHIHIPEGAISKDGPSAGITLTTVLISLLANKEVDSSIAMTGEMTLRGKVLAIGGLKEKVIGAHRAKIKTIFLPKDNEKDLEDIPKELRKEMEFILVKDYEEIYKKIFSKKRKS